MASAVGAPVASDRRVTLVVLAVGALAILGLFGAEVAAAVRVWRGSTAFGHCFLVLPIAAWLAWERRGAASGVPGRPLPWLALAAIPLGVAWLVAERLGIMEGRQLVVLATLQVLALATLGWRLWGVFVVPLLYLFFLVPFGGFLVPTLQAFTARFVDGGLTVLGIPHVVDALRIEIPSGVFRVAEACAGLRFLVAAIAFGVLYACVMFRDPWRRAAFMLASLAVPVLANGVRALGIVVLGDWLGSPQAASVDHVLYGWIFFALVIGLLILAGLPFREDVSAPPPARAGSGVARRGRQSATCWAAASVFAGVAWAPGLAAWLDGRAAAESVSLAGGAARAWIDERPVPDGCRTEPPGATNAGAARPLGQPALARRFDCGDWMLRVFARGFGRHAGAAALIAARRVVGREIAAEDVSVDWIEPEARDGASSPEDSAGGSVRLGAARWRLTQSTEPATMGATWLAVDGRADLDGWELRERLALASLRGADQPALLLAVTAEPTGEPAGEPAGLSPDGARARLLISAVIAGDAGPVGPPVPPGRPASVSESEQRRDQLEHD